MQLRTSQGLFHCLPWCVACNLTELISQTLVNPALSVSLTLPPLLHSVLSSPEQAMKIVWTCWKCPDTFSLLCLPVFKWFYSLFLTHTHTHTHTLSCRCRVRPHCHIICMSLCVGVAGANSRATLCAQFDCVADNFDDNLIKLTSQSALGLTSNIGYRIVTHRWVFISTFFWRGHTSHINA